MTRIYSFIILLLAMLSLTISCNKASSESNGKDSIEVEKPQPSNTIKLDSVHSLIKNKNTAVPAYEIVSADSFIIDIKDYNFYLPDPAFTYIRDNINYKEMVVTASSFAYVNVISGDSTLSYKSTEFKKSPDNNTITVKIKDKRVDDFKLAFRFYIDNGKGEQEIDAFNVKVAGK